jgi:hypothetical protein
MVLDRCESSEHATTCWHQCPLCKQVRLTSDPVPASSVSGNAFNRYDDGSYLVESEAAMSADFDTHLDLAYPLT